jgi:large repetitive protein
VSAGTAATTPGSVVHYTVTVTNTGQTPYTGAAFTDPLAGVLDDAAYDNDAAATAGTVSFASPNLSWSGNLAVGTAATITFSVTVNNPDTGNEILASTITSATPGSNCAVGSGDLPCTATVNVAVLTITNNSNVTTVTPGGVVRFTSVFTNSGQVPYTGITVASNIANVLDDATPNGDQTATSGALVLTSTGISWTGSIPVGGTVTVTGTVTVNNPDTGNKVMASTLTTTAAGSNCPSGGTDPRCSVSVTVLTPALTIVSTANAPAAVSGQPVTFTVTVTNTGQTPYSGAVVTDSLNGALDDAAYNGDAAATTGSLSYAAPVLTWTGNLVVGASAVITYTMTVSSPDTGDKVIINTATSAATGSACPPGATAAPCRVTVAVLTPGLAIVLTAGSGTTTPGSVVHYTVTVTNTGQTPYTGGAFTDPLSGVLDDAAYDNDAAATAGSVTFASPNLNWTGNLAVGATATITFSVTVSNPDSGNKILASTITSATPGSNCPAGNGDLRCTATVPVAVLTITASSSVSTVTPSGVVRFTTVFVNSGQVPYTGITIASNIADVRDDATPNGDQTATSGTLTLTATGISWTGSIPVGGTVTITGTVTVNNPDTGNKVLTNNFSTAAAGSDCPSGGTDPRCSVSVAVLIPALTIVKSADVSTTSPGGVIHYTVTVTDSGQTPYTGATYTDQLDGVLGDAAYNGDAAATVGSVSFASPDLTWTGNLTAGATATITYSVTVNNPDTGNRILTNTVVSSTPGTDCPVGGADPRCTVTVDDLVPGLDIVASADKPTATPGTVVHYTITATNTGQAAYTGARFTDPLTGVLDDAAYNGDATATAGSVTFASPNLNWTGNLAVGAVATITFSVTVNNPETGNGTLASTITSATVGNNCPVSGGTDPSCAVTVTAVNAATLTFTATADTAAAAAGGVVHDTITVANSGLTPYNGATFTAGLGGVPGNATYDGDAAATSGSLTVTNPSLAWTGNVPASGTVTITYSVTVNSPDTGNDILTSIITSTSAESDCGAGSADPRCTATVDVAALAITATTDAATTSPGSDVQYTVTAVNTGQAAYSDTSITLDFSDVFEDATYNGDLAATSGTLTTDATAGTGTWTGDLAPGATVTITFSVTIIPPDSDLNDRVPTLTVDSAALGNNCPAGGTDPGCSAGVTVLVPALTITKTANTTAAVPGATVTYTITIADTGDTPYTGATVADTLTGVLGDATYNNDAAAASGALSYASPTLAWTGNLTVGATVTIIYTVTVRNPDRGGKLMVNTVTSTATGSTCPPGATSPGCTLTIPVLTPALTIVKTASAATAVPGQKVSYTITVTDTGQTSYTGAVVTDALTGVLDDAAYDTDAAASTGSVSYASPVLTWTGNLTVGAVATITYSVIVNNPDTGDKILTDTAISAASGSNCRSGSTDPRCASTVTISQLIINSTADVTTTTPGGVVHYTTTLTNTGQTPYYGIAMSSDGAGLADDAVSNGDETATSGTFSLGTTGAVWTGDLPVGGTVTLTGSVTVDNPDTGDHIMTETNTSDAPGSNCPTGSTGPPCSTTITVLTPALTITTTANTPAAVPGQQVTFTVTLTDTGQTSYTGAVVTDDLTGALNDAAYDGDAAATTGSVGYTAPVLTWTGNLAVGGTAVITYSVTVHNPDNGDKTVSAAVASSAAGSTCPPASANLGCGLTVPVLTPALTIVKTASAATATPGQKVSYTITVTDTGQTSYTGAVVTDALTGVLDDAAYDSDAAASTGTTSYASPVLTWTGNLTPGQAATITYSVTVSNPDTGDKVLTGNLTTAASGANCAAGSTDPRCTATVDVAVLAITNTANVSTTTPGSSVAYTITIANTGQVFYDGATVTDPLSAVTDDAAFDNDAATTAGSITYTAPNLTWTGDLVPGASATITFTVTVSNPDTGDKILASTLTSASPGSTCPAAGPAPACTATVTDLIPALAITKTAATTTTTPGSAVGYTITITDTGQTPYTGVTVTDDLTGLVSDAAYDNDAAATAGTVTYTTPVLTWTGNLAPGGTAAITYTVTTASPDTGDKHLVNTVASTAPGSTCPPGNTNPACTATVTDLIPALTITKTDTVAATTPGSAVGFTITVADTGQTPYTAATVTDSLSGDLADAAYNNDAAATTGTVTYTTPVLTWTGNLTPGNTATITYSVTVNNPDTGGGALSNTVVSTATGSTCPSGGTGSGCSVTVAVVAGPLTMTAPATASLGSAAPGGTLSAGLGTIQVTDDRGFGAGWTATVSATSFATGAGTPAETIPAADAQYNISGLGMTTGSATFTPVPTTRLSARPKAVVNATNVAGNTTVTWDPTIVVTIPGSAIGGTYAATIIHSVS